MQKSGVMVILNGCCGVGKSTVGRILYKRLQGHNFHFFDTDEYIFSNPNVTYDANIYSALGRMDVWHVRLMEKTPIRRILKRNNLLLTDNFVSDRESQYLQELLDDGITLVHFILEADRGTVVDRLAEVAHKEPKRTEMRISGFECANAYLKTHYPYATRINTVGRTADEVASELYSRIAVL